MIAKFTHRIIRLWLTSLSKEFVVQATEAQRNDDLVAARILISIAGALNQADGETLEHSL